MNKPFLTIVTRCSRRPRALLRCVRSVTKQTDLAIEHLFLVDHDHRGLKYANQQFYRYRNVPRGEYVWALDDDDRVNDESFVETVRDKARETDADVILVKTIHEHTGRIHPEPQIWNLDWESGERPTHWVGGGYCVVVKRDVWAAHLANYFDGQDKDWATGGDWHFITSLIKNTTLQFARCEVIAGRQPSRGYGQEMEDCGPRWFEAIRDKLELERVTRDAYRFRYDEAMLEWADSPFLLIEKPLKILQCAQWDWAACAYFLSKAIQHHTIHTSRAIRWRTTGSFDFPTDIVSPTADEFRRLWDWADIIHIHDSAPIPGRFPDKPTVITMHGSRYRKSPAKYQRLANRRGWLLTVATPDLTMKHGAPWMPDTRFGLPPKQEGPKRLVALHCPSIRANKQTEAVITAVESLPDVDLQLIEDVPWLECVRIKASAGHAVLIDQLEWGYGCNAIEAWTYGLPVIANAVGEAAEGFQNLFGYFPFLRATPKTIRAAVKSMLDCQVYDRIRAIGIGHLERYHTPQAASRIALGYYARAHEGARIVKKAPKKTGAVGEPGLALLRYRGSNLGRMTFRGPKTNQRYHFSAIEREKYVDKRDVPGFLAMEHHTLQLFEVIDA